jgi:hypothetical protein
MRALDSKTDDAAQLEAIPIASRMVRRLTTSQSMRNEHMKDRIEPLQDLYKKADEAARKRDDIAREDS